MLVLQVGVDVDGGGVVTVAHDAHGDLGGDAGGDAAGDVVMAERMGGDVGIVVIGDIGGFAGFACFQGGGAAGFKVTHRFPVPSVNGWSRIPVPLVT